MFTYIGIKNEKDQFAFINLKGDVSLKKSLTQIKNI